MLTLIFFQYIINILKTIQNRIKEVKKMKKIELLAPAGSFEKAKIAFLYGADAVYLGGKLYNLRANATNFSLEDLKEGCQFAHKLGKKVFLTLNIVFHNEDILGVNDYINRLRIEKSVFLLTNTNMNINEISYEVGFSYPRYFSTSFKQIKGMTPTRFKEENKKN